MAAVNPKSLASKLNPLCRDALQNALGLCLSQTNYEVEIEHWLMKLLEPTDSDLSKILRQYDVNRDRLNRELTSTLEKFRRGSGRAGGSVSVEGINWSVAAGSNSLCKSTRRATCITISASSSTA